MMEQRITRLVFWLDWIVLSSGPEGRLQPGLAQVLDEVRNAYELWLVSSYPARQTAAVMSMNSLSSWFGDAAVHLLPEASPAHPVLLVSLVAAGVIIPGSSLWIDNHPQRTMIAIRHGIDASIFVDARRLRRDLALWGIVT